MGIMITGATGCVGQYLTEALLQRTDRRLTLMIRNPGKMPAEVRADPRVTVHWADMADTPLSLPDLDGIDTLILLATAWGGAETQRVIRDVNLALAERAEAAGCRRILYFSTASVLNRDLDLSPEAASIGTDYIKGKHALTQAMDARGGDAQVVGLFPTLVMGGHPDGPKPMSHFGGLLHQLRPWMHTLRFLTAEGRLHMIHAADIATVCVHLAQQPAGADLPRRIVLGNPAQSVDSILADFTRYAGYRRRPLLRLRPTLRNALLRLSRAQLSQWDRYSMDHPDQSYPDAVNPADFGLPVHMPDIAAGLRDLGVPGGR